MKDKVRLLNETIVPTQLININSTPSYITYNCSWGGGRQRTGREGKGGTEGSERWDGIREADRRIWGVESK